jgi:crossover junction endodeoxyribonuclease RusA
MTFEVSGTALTQGSHRIGWTKRGRAVVVPDGGQRRLQVYREQIRVAARLAMGQHPSHFPVDGPIWLSIDFVRKAPKRGARQGYAATRPDIDKLARAVLDALTGVLYHDDAQVVDLHLSKIWAPDPRTLIRFELIQ